MRSRLLIVLAALVALALTAGCDKPTAYAAKVGNGEISDEMFRAHLDEWSAAEPLLEALGTSSQAVPGAAPNSWSMTYAGNILTTMVVFEIQDQEFDRQHLQVDDNVVTQIEETLVGDAESTAAVWKKVSPEFKDYLVQEIAQQDALQAALGDEYTTFIQDQVQRDDIEINSKYGSWSSAGGVIAPTGPQPAPIGT